MRFKLTLVALVSSIALSGNPAQAADHLDCMVGQFGDPERIVIDRKIQPHRGNENLDAVALQIVQSRARTCAFLNNWSDEATKMAFSYSWTRVSWAIMDAHSVLTDQEQDRLATAIESKHSQFLAAFEPSIAALRQGAPSPPPSEAMFRDFRYVFLEANIPENEKTKNAVEGWLYMHGMLMAISTAFSSE